MVRMYGADLNPFIVLAFRIVVHKLYAQRRSTALAKQVMGAIEMAYGEFSCSQHHRLHLNLRLSLATLECAILVLLLVPHL
jgi:hypothetical protein